MKPSANRIAWGATHIALQALTKGASCQRHNALLCWGCRGTVSGDSCWGDAVLYKMRSDAAHTLCRPARARNEVVTGAPTAGGSTRGGRLVMTDESMPAAPAAQQNTWGLARDQAQP